MLDLDKLRDLRWRILFISVIIDYIRALQEEVLCFRLAKHRNTLLLSSALSKKPDAASHNSQQSPSELLLLVDKFVRGEPLIGSVTEDF